MDISKVAIAVAVSTGFLFGCNTDALEPPTETPEAASSGVTGKMWQLSEASISALSATASSTFSSANTNDQGLANVYVFSADGSTQKFYTDESSGGVLGVKYEIFESTYTETISGESEGNIEFDYYNADGTINSKLSSSYSVAGDVLSLPDANTPLSGDNKSSVSDVKDAVEIADDESGIDNAVQIADTNLGGVKEDTGELRLKLTESKSGVGSTISFGKLTVDITYQKNAESSETDVGQNNAYISLYSTNDEDNKVSNTYHHGDIAIGDGTYKFRDSSGSLISTGGSYDTEAALVTPVEIVWDTNSITFTINGETYTGEVAAASSGEVQVIALRLGTNSATSPYELIADNLKIYSKDSAEGEYKEVFEDDFDSYTTGFSLVNSGIYNSSTSEATVISVSGTTNPEEPVDPTDNKVAAITDQDTGDTGELRYKFSNGMTTGTHKVSMYYDKDESESAYVALFDTANSTSSLIGELKLDEGKVTLRGEGEQVATFTPGNWVDLEMSWDTSSTETVGSYTVKVNGIEYGPYDSQNATPGVEVTATAIKFSSNSGTADTTLYIDNYKVYTDTAGTTELFSDDFEGYTLDTSLDSEINEASPYNGSTFSVVVANDPLAQE